MVRRWCACLLVIATMATVSVDVFACGDKLLRVGRSPRFRRYASVHRSAILVYAPRWTAAGIKAFEGILRKGGHTPTTVTSTAAMSQAFAAGKYDLVITSYADADAVRQQINGITARPLLLPVVYKPKEQEDKQARATYTCVLRPDKMNDYQALAEIDRLFDLQGTGRAVSAERR